MAGVKAFLQQTLWEAYGERLLSASKLYETSDRSYGRCAIPFSPMEKRLHVNEDIDIWFGNVRLANGKDWCWYQVWEHKHAPRPAQGTPRPDILFVHGTGVHSGTLASHARRYLEAGFRLIVPDLASHGYSSGPHVYQRHMRGYTQGLHAVLQDVARRDDAARGVHANAPSRSAHQETFMLGLSFGGTVALHYALQYPDSIRGSAAVEQGQVPIDGLVVVGPILGYSPHNITMPCYLAKAILLMDAMGMGSMELMVPHKKCLDKDPKVYTSLIDEDKRSHQGAFRVGHLLCINDAVMDLHQHAASIRHPVYIQQGGQDRVACPQKTVQWIQRIASTDKRMTIYPVCQHVIFRKAKTEEEDLAGRVACIEDNVAWMMERARGAANTKAEKQPSARPTLRLCTSASVCPSPSTPAALSSDASDGLCDSLPSPAISLPPTPCFSERSFASDCTESTSTSISTSPSRDAHVDVFGAVHHIDASHKTFSSSSRFTTIQPHEETYQHPLLSRAHKTTLPTLATMCPERSYRPFWTLDQELCPFDINIRPNWTTEERAAREAQASSMDPFSSFSA